MKYLIPILFLSYFPLLQWWGLFDSTDPTQWNPYQAAAYWHCKDSLLYALLFCLLQTWGTTLRNTAIFARFVATCLQAWIVIAFIDLQLAGNFLTGTLWDWWDLSLIAAGITYAGLAWLFVWRKLPKQSDPIEPESVYLITRPPRSMMELLGTVFALGPAGPVAVIIPLSDQFAWLGVDRKSGRYVREWHLGQFKPRAGQIARKIAVEPGDAIVRFDLHLAGRRWSWFLNCFRAAKKII